MTYASAIKRQVYVTRLVDKPDGIYITLGHTKTNNDLVIHVPLRYVDKIEYEAFVNGKFSYLIISIVESLSTLMDMEHNADRYAQRN